MIDSGANRFDRVGARVQTVDHPAFEAMVDAIVNIANGHTFRGLGGVIAGFFRNQSANKRTAKELNND